MDLTYLNQEEVEWANHHLTLATVSPDYLEVTAEGLKLSGLSATWDHLVEPGSKRAKLREHCTPATPELYRKWIIGYQNRGQKIHKFYGRPLVPGEFWLLRTAPKNFPRLYGAAAYQIIVPADVKVDISEIGDIGHSDLYFMKNFTTTDNYVYSYTNTR